MVGDARDRSSRRLGGAWSRRALLRASAGALVLSASGAFRRRPLRAQSVDEEPDAAAPQYASVLRSQLQQLVEALFVPGAAVMVRSPQLGDWSATFGTRSLGGTEPVTLADHVRVGSNTKTMTATVILQLVDEGALSLDDPVSIYRPEVPNGDQISITQLLDMRSGLYNYSESLALSQTLDDSPQHVYAPEDLLAIAFEQPPYFSPGAGYHYSNTNYILLGLILEQLTGDSASTAFQTRIFEPLGLTQTLLPALDSAAIPDPHPRGYMFGTNAETVSTQVLSAEQQAQAAAGTFLPTDVTDENPSWGWTAGSGISTADDLIQYVQALGGGGLISSALQAQRLASLQPTDPTNPASTEYGLGIAKLGPMLGHTGELPGFNSFMGYDPVQDLAVVTWTTLAATPDGRAPAAELAKLVISQLYNSSTQIQAPSR